MKEFNKIFLDEFDAMSKKEKVDNIWQVALKVLSKYSEPYLLTLKADLDILKLITDGFSAHAISNRLGIPSTSVFEVAAIWGFSVLDTSLELNPFVIYHDGMSSSVFLMEYNSLVPVGISKIVAETVIRNIEHYHNDILSFLQEADK